MANERESADAVLSGIREEASMNSATTSSEKITEALKLLEEAAREKKDEIRHLLTDKYTHLKDALAETEHSVAGTLTAAQKRAVEAIIHAKEVGQEKVKKAATVVDGEVHTHPWPYIGGVALTAFLLGFVLGRKK
jgi:ElaB/YqjD/DUF883 family membrane-anchored ribosome-binding protein